MATLLQNVSIKLPEADLKLLQELATKMGWIFSLGKEHKGTLEEAVADYKSGNIHKAKDTDDLMKQLLN